jgi:branched-chain amino acid aminotransferase
MIPEDDRGFLLGDGLFETFRTFERRPLLLARHLRRLTAAASEMRLPLASFDLEKMIRTRAEEQDIRHGSLRLTVTRGSGARGLMPPAKPEPRLILSAAPASPRSTSPVRAIISEVRRSAGSPSARMKTLSYNDNIMARMKAEEESAADAILFTDDGDAASTSLANILVLKDDR